eukprot:7128-Eustigmatos_ZCMA.PRE.1
MVERGRAVGVRLKDGQVIRARKAVVSGASIWDTARLIPSDAQDQGKLGACLIGRESAGRVPL